MKKTIAMLAVVLSAQSALALTAKCDIIEKMGEESTTNSTLMIELDAEGAGTATNEQNIQVDVYFSPNKVDNNELTVTTPFLSGRAAKESITVTDGYQSVNVSCALENQN